MALGQAVSLFFLLAYGSGHGSLFVWVGGLDSWDPLMKVIVLSAHFHVIPFPLRSQFKCTAVLPRGSGEKGAVFWGGSRAAGFAW